MKQFSRRRQGASWRQLEHDVLFAEWAEERLMNDRPQFVVQPIECRARGVLEPTRVGEPARQSRELLGRKRKRKPNRHAQAAEIEDRRVDGGFERAEPSGSPTSNFTGGSG